MLRRIGARYWGLFDESVFDSLHEAFLTIDERLQVTSMTLENISQKLLRLGYVESVRAANTTAMYAIQWMSGERFDLNKRQVQQHRSRLRKLGIDIARPCDTSQHSTVFVRKAKEVVPSKFVTPDWYQQADARPNLTLVA